MNDIPVFALGFLAQTLFFGRTFLQWFKSENEGKVMSPGIYWKISLAASLLMIFYGILRNDFAIILGQAIVYFIYVRNLQLKKIWGAWPYILRLLIVAAPFGVILWLLTGSTYSFRTILGNSAVPPWLLITGVAGQLIFTFRFVVQWLHSEKEKESLLPSVFWIISTAGALIIFVYAVFRRDPVLFLSNGLGLFIYVRNILIHAGGKSLIHLIDHQIIRDFSLKISRWIR